MLFGCWWWVFQPVAEAGAIGSELSWVEVRHIGSRPIEIEGLRLATADGSSLADVEIEVIRGACELLPGEEALLITSPAVPTDDQARLRYRNLYRAESLDDGRLAVPAQSLTLIAAGGSLVADGPLGPAPVGMCCDRTDCTGGKCGDENMCAAQVTKATCCADNPWDCTDAYGGSPKLSTVSKGSVIPVAPKVLSAPSRNDA